MYETDELEVSKVVFSIDKSGKNRGEMADQAAMADPSEAPLQRSKRKRWGQSGDIIEETPRRHMTLVDVDAMSEIVEHMKMFRMMKTVPVLHL